MALLPDDFNWRTSDLIANSLKAELEKDVLVFGHCNFYVWEDKEKQLHFERRSPIRAQEALRQAQHYLQKWPSNEPN